jgi:hypothetical protein
MKNITQLFQEAKMASSVYGAFLNSSKAHGIKIGFEAEVCFPVGADGAEIPDERIRDIVKNYSSRPSFPISRLSSWFAEHSSSYDTDGFAEKLEEDFTEWQEAELEKDWEDAKYSVVEDYLDRYSSFHSLISDKIAEAGEEEIDLSPEEYNKFHQAALAELTQETIDNEDSDYDSAKEKYFMRLRREYDLEVYFHSKRLRTTHDLVAEYGNFLSMEARVDFDFKSSAEYFADSLRNRLNLNDVAVSGGHSSEERTDSKWILEPDSSINPPEGHFGCEIVSPPIPAEDFFEVFERVFKFLRFHDALTDSEYNTGLHIGVSVPGYSEHFDPMKLLMFIGDDYILGKFGREANHFCKNYSKVLATHGFLELINAPEGEEKISQVFQRMKAGLSTLAGRLLRAFLDSTHAKSRYVSVNIKDKYIEFRSMGGNYLDALPAAQETVKRMVYAMWLACNPEEQKQEYLKKLYAFIKQGLPEADPSGVDLFAKYASGEIDKYDLVRSLKQKRE